jgi:'Cold-shock' DNA-binding domain
MVSPRTQCVQEKAVMTTGQVKFFNTTNGFGFIAPEDGAGWSRPAPFPFAMPSNRVTLHGRVVETREGI